MLVCTDTRNCFLSAIRLKLPLVRSETTMGRGQVVRHQVLVLAFGGSNPSAPAKVGKWINDPFDDLVLCQDSNGQFSELPRHFWRHFPARLIPTLYQNAEFFTAHRRCRAYNR